MYVIQYGRRNIDLVYGECYACRDFYRELIDNMKELLVRLRLRLGRLSFRTGMWVLGFCVLWDATSFAQMLLPTPAWLKGVLWAVFYGLAKASQYTALLILGKAGWERLKSFIALRKDRC